MRLDARLRRLEGASVFADRACPDCGRVPGTRLLPGGQPVRYVLEFQTEVGAKDATVRCPTCGTLLVASLEFDEVGRGS